MAKRGQVTGDHLVWLLVQMPGMSEAELARLMFVSRKVINDWKQGKTTPAKTRQRQLVAVAGDIRKDLMKLEGANTDAPEWYRVWLFGHQEAIKGAVEQYSRTIDKG